MYTRTCYGKRDMLYNYSEFVCDATSDIETLPTTKKTGFDWATCSVGSKALIIETGETYMLNNADTWVLLESTSGSVTSSTEYATADETKAYLEI